MENSEKGLRAEVTTNYLRLTDAAIRSATLPPGKSQHYLHDTEQPGPCHQDARDWWADVGLLVHQAWDERHATQDAGRMA